MTDQPDMKHKLGGAVLVRDRKTWLLEQARDRNVVHIGCVDTGFLEMKLGRDDLLHTQLERVCSGLVGLDNNAEGIRQLQEQGVGGLICGDISDQSQRIIESITRILPRCDLIYCGEVLEHVLDCGQFLAGVRELALVVGARVIITVPNAFSLEGFASVFRGTENVHPDHKCYFSQVTLTTLLDQVGYQTTEICFYSRARAASRIRRATKALVHKTLFAVRPQLAEGLIVIAEPRPSMGPED